MKWTSKRAHEACLYLVAVLSALGVIGELGGAMQGVFVLGVGASLVAGRTGFGQKVPTLFWNVFILLALVFTGQRMIFSDDDSILVGGVRFIVILLLLKLISRRGGERDDWQIYALSLLLMSAGTAMNETMAYGAIFVLYVIVGTYGLTLFHLHSEHQRQRLGAAGGGLWGGYRVAFGVMGGLILCLSVALFFLFPRVGLGFFVQKSREQASMIGFSDEVSLGGHGVIRDNPEVAMRVYFPGNLMPPEAASWHWRMMSFDTYDGVRWRREEKPRPQDLDRIKGERYRYDLTPLASPAIREEMAGARAWDLRVYMEPLKVDQAPTLWVTSRYGLPTAIPMSFNPGRALLRHDTHFGDLSVVQRNDLGVMMEMRVMPELTLPGPKQQGAYLPKELERTEAFRQLPAKGMGEIAKLSRQITQGKESPYEKAAAISWHLQQNYSYTTNLPPVDPEAPVQDFLFRTKRGHCEFYATSMVLLLRASGVSARIVNGFLGGRWNEVGKYMAVRQGDAHSWVEVHIPTVGWVPFDPTPASDVLPVKPDPATAWLNDAYDAARMAWVSAVIEYDLDKQLAVLRRLGQALAPGDGTSKAAKAPEDPGAERSALSLPWRQAVIWLVYLGLCLLAYTLGAGAVRRHRGGLAMWGRWGLKVGLCAGLGVAWMGWVHQGQPSFFWFGATGPLLCGSLGLLRHRVTQGTGEALALERLFRGVEKVAARVGVTRGLDEGPGAFFERVGQALPHEAAGLVHDFSSQYLALRFGKGEASAKEIQELRRLLTTLKKSSSRPRKS